MSRKVAKRFTPEEKQKILEEYTSGKKSASDLALEHDVSTGLIYQWKSDQKIKDRNSRVKELEDSGMNRAMALKIQQQEAEIEAYQKKVAEQAIIIDLLKKLPAQSSFQSESELNGLLKTMTRSVQKRRPVK